MHKRRREENAVKATTANCCVVGHDLEDAPPHPWTAYDGNVEAELGVNGEHILDRSGTGRLQP